jgi:DNA-binding NarL/FixJ family response regulator
MRRAASSLRERDLAASAPLSPREEEIASLLALGLSNAAIAERLCISPYTVKNHVHQVLAKLALRSRWQVEFVWAEAPC